MPKYYRIKVDGIKAYIVDDENNPLEPEFCEEIANRLLHTATTPVYLYLATALADPDDLWKIGISIEPERRARELNAILECCFPCPEWGEISAKAIETALHNVYSLAGKHVKGEWFKLTRYDTNFIAKLQKGTGYLAYDNHHTVIGLSKLLTMANHLFNTDYTQPKHYSLLVDWMYRIPDWKKLELEERMLYSRWEPLFKHGHSKDFKRGSDLTSTFPIYLADQWRFRLETSGNTELAKHYENLYISKMLNYLLKF
jgi:hypothetical protein